MQTQDSNTGTPDIVNHPDAAEWMDFLYGELAPERRHQLGVHLAQCAECERQVKTWRASMTALDESSLPAMRRAPSQWPPVLKWATAAAVVLCLGFVLGRQTSATSDEVAALKSSVAQLTETVNLERKSNTDNVTSTATTAANAETVRLLSEYAKADQAGRTEDQQAVALALHDFDLRLGRLRSELETVAVNTEDGFYQTQQGLTQLASLTIPNANEADHTP